MCLAVPGQVVTVAEDPLRTATVSFGGVTKSVSLALVPEAGVGDYVIVHVGFALHTVDEEEAQETLKLLKEIGAVAGDPGSEGT